MTQRSDARRNRELLVNAAEHIFSEHGPNAPLQLVTQHAQVGRGTLYRHFPQRAALILALFERRVTELETAALAAPHAPETAQRLLADTLDQQRRTPGLTRIVLDSAEHAAHLERLTGRIEAALDQPIAAARAVGRLHPDIRPRDFLTAWAMFEGVTATYAEDHYAHRVHRARELILRSLLTAEGMANTPAARD